MGRQQGERVLGPYRDGHSWKVIHVGADGARTSRSCSTEEEARDTAEALRSLIRDTAAKTVGQAVEAYEVYLRTEKRNKARSVDETIRRLRKFFPDGSIMLKAHTEERCKARYSELASTLAVDSHRNTLAEVKTFLRWCVGQRWLPASPADGLKGVGKRRRGKPQLRLDEARRWTDKAEELASEREVGAVAALVTLYLDVRASELAAAAVRDLDDGGRVLWISDSKTEAGRRILEVPEFLQPYLLQVAGNRPATEPLFGHTRSWVWWHVARICRLAGVPRVGAHSMRGLHASLAFERGATGHQVALAMGHSSPAVTHRHYAKPEAVARGKRTTVLQLLKGGVR
jgi:integrase